MLPTWIQVQRGFSRHQRASASIRKALPRTPVNCHRGKVKKSSSSLLIHCWEGSPQAANGFHLLLEGLTQTRRPQKHLKPGRMAIFHLGASHMSTVLKFHMIEWPVAKVQGCLYANVNVASVAPSS